MPLPKIDLPIYTDSFPSSGKEFKYRPFTVKEQKLFLMAIEGAQTSDDVIDAINQVVNNCVISDGFDILNAPTVDVEYVFLKLRAKSMGEKIELRYVCQSILEQDSQQKCGASLEVSVDLNQVTAKTMESSVSNLQIGQCVVTLRYPSFSKTSNVVGQEKEDIKLIASCIERIVRDDEIFNASEYTEDELIEFIESMTEADSNKIETWLEKEPKIHWKNSITCPKCSSVHEIELEGLYDFFQ